MIVKLLDEGVLVEELDKNTIPTTVYLKRVSGGKRVCYIDACGNIVKSMPLSRSPYNPNKPIKEEKNMEDMSNLGNLVFVEPEYAGGVYVLEEDLVPEEEALTPTGRVKRQYTKLVLDSTLKKYLYVREIYAESSEAKTYSDNDGWCQPDGTGRGMYVNLSEPACYGVLIVSYDYIGAHFTDGDTKVYF